jgi:flavodoxin
MKYPPLFKGLLILMLTSLSITGKSQEPSETSRDADLQRILIVYLTRTENTAAVAQVIHQELGGDMQELKPQTAYPEEYKAIVSQVDQENETGYLPPLATKIDNIRDYDTIFLGFPTWDSQLPPPMKSFLDQYDLSGKTVALFNTNGGYGIGSSFEDVKERCSGCNLLEGFSVEGGLERDGIYLTIKGERQEKVRAEVMDWLRSIKLLLP